MYEMTEQEFLAMSDDQQEFLAMSDDQQDQLENAQAYTRVLAGEVEGEEE